MKPETGAPPRGGHHGTIRILIVAGAKESVEIDRILSHTRWQLRFVHTCGEAMRALHSSPVSVVLCEQQLPDGSWQDIVQGTEQLSQRPQTIVLSTEPDPALWAEIISRGGYDLLAMPLDAREIYTLIPMAWRRCHSPAKSPSGETEGKPLHKLAEVS